MGKLNNILSNLGLFIRNFVVPAAFVFLLLFFVSFAEKSANEQKCSQVIIRIFPDDKNQFLDRSDIMNCLLSSNGGILKNRKLKELNTLELEKGLMKNNFVENAEVYYDLKGNLFADVYFRTPVLRIITFSGKSYYLDMYGNQMPLSLKHTAKILVATGYIERAKRAKDFEFKLFELADFIRKDPLLNALIGQIHVKFDGEIILIPRLEDISIEFGKADQVEYKFKKLKVFYHKILPFEGWNKFDRVDLRYSNQIVLNRK